MDKKRFEGLIAAVVTPMKADGEINLAPIDAYADYLVKRGVRGVFVCGTTGESMLLETDERKREAEAWMRHADRLKILIHVGSTSYKTAGELAAHAEKIGAEAISSMGPCFLQPKRVEELVAFNKVIAARAPRTPYYYYHIPGTSGVDVNPFEFLKRASAEIPTLNGIKYTSFDLFRMQECIRFADRGYDILHGHDELLLSGLAVGARGAIGTSYNVTAPLYNRLLDAFHRGDLAEAAERQAEAGSFIEVLLRYVNSVVSIKAMLNIAGIDCGPCRLPLRNLTAAEMRSLENDLKAFDWL